jgi:hypothetical protein
VILWSLWATLSTATPTGIKDDSRNLLAILLILLANSAASEHRKSSNVSQSQFCTPDHIMRNLTDG